MDVSLIQTLSYSPTQSPPTFRNLSGSVTSFCMPSSQTSVANPFNHSLKSFFTPFIACETSATQKFLQCWKISENHLGPRLGLYSGYSKTPQPKLLNHRLHSDNSIQAQITWGQDLDYILDTQKLPNQNS